MARVSDLLAAGRTYSFEFFPPKTDGAQLSLGHTIAELEPLAPSFVSVTYGAGGSTRSRTHDIVSWVRRETSITPMAHLTCQGHTARRDRRDPRRLPRRRHREHPRPGRRSARRSRRPPAERLPVRLRPARRHRHAATSRSASPPTPRSTPARPTGTTDRRLLAAKLARADFAITQFFFEAEHYVRLVDELAALGVDKPVLPGIMPITNGGQIAPDGRAQRRGPPRLAGRPTRRRRGPGRGAPDRRRRRQRAVRRAARAGRAGAAPLHAQPQHGEPGDLRQPRARPRAGGGGA